MTEIGSCLRLCHTPEAELSQRRELYQIFLLPRNRENRIFSLPPLTAAGKTAKTGLSTYGAKNSRETVAEAWAEYKMNPTPRQIALDIGREIDKLSLEGRNRNT